MSRETCTIRNGDVVELIPGHHFFKFVATCGEKNSSSPNKHKRASNEGNKVSEEDEFLSRKRIRQVSQDEVFARNLQVSFP